MTATRPSAGGATSGDAHPPAAPPTDQRLRAGERAACRLSAGLLLEQPLVLEVHACMTSSLIAPRVAPG